ncbi:protein kinase C-like, phorbol ester/diacylglycerol-binding domain, DC1 [Artemisia annua]|uniref:Protein kinase C-like, phorbol ester/diacylglycerol-binding domain, DC1 n=1 Tax=Artemisia annua TaxID=35608 RepID=A0A2U1KTG8_ARTAN|nr:protein kinase C-like, phorbol ester/diacylglycerol-binding domain, DC1 [Artemisia annua]
MESQPKLQNPENIITSILHEHPLQLVDLQPCYPDYTEYSDDEEEDRVIKWDFNSPCNQCRKVINVYHRYYYKCTDICDYVLHKSCAQAPPTTLIVKSHSLTHKLTLSQRDNKRRYCFACETYIHDEWYYDCSICPRYWVYFRSVHVKCAMIGRENHIIYHPSHPHPLCTVISQTILCKCDACGKKHEGYAVSVSVVHIFGFISVKVVDISKTIKNYKDADHPDLLKLPFPDQTYSILKHCFSKESGTTSVETSERNLKHIGHEHVLSLVGTQSNDSKGASSSSVSSLSCHNPMKSIELLCNGCVRPIMDVPFYKCSNEDQRCDFVLHEWCTRLPAELRNYPGHAHTLRFLPKVSEKIFGIFDCEICELRCNGFAYGCTECQYYIDVNCGFIPEEITHEAHPDHILSRCDRWSMRKPCVAEGSHYYGSKISFDCVSCDFGLHSGCALFLPGIINHKLDKHPMKLTYGPVENHKSEYFCEVCEEELDPTKWFYHCNVCAYSLHTRCAPVILNFEAAINSSRSLYWYLNIKFGGVYNIKGHEHSVSLAPGTDADEVFISRKPHGMFGSFWHYYVKHAGCESCDFYLHSDCALFFPGITNHKLDKHPVKLTYGPVEKHKSEYVCEVREEELDPNKWFYHCNVCAYSLHTRCAPVILNFQAAFRNDRSLYEYLNIKFGGIYKIKGHEHSVSLALGSDADGICPTCDDDMEYDIIIKCQKCKVAMHHQCCRD